MRFSGFHDFQSDSDFSWTLIYACGRCRSVAERFAKIRYNKVVYIASFGPRAVETFAATGNDIFSPLEESTLLGMIDK